MFKLIQNFFSGFPDNLRRITSGSGFIPEIDGLRFLAILPVVLQHFSERIIERTPVVSASDQHISGLLANGHVGVYVFFAISGFILALPFGRYKLQNRQPVQLSSYYLRRLTRLEPPYLISLILFFVVLVVVQHQDFNELLPHFFASCLYIHRIVYGVWSPLNPPAWTLEVEVQFYAIAPFLTLFYFSIRSVVRRRAVILGFILIKIIVANTTSLFDQLNLTLPYAVEFFTIGILITDIYLTEWKNGIPRHRIFDLVTVLSIIVLFSSWTWHKNLDMKFVFITALFMTLYGCFRSIAVNAFFRNKWISAIGGMCYSIYLLHLPAAEFFTRLIVPITPDTSYTMRFLIGVAIFLPALFVICTAFFLLIEKPCMDPQWPQKLWARLRAPLKKYPQL